MQAYKHIVVGLDLTKMDVYILQYLSHFLKLITPEKVYFLNFQKNLDLPNELLRKYPMFTEPKDERIKRQLQNEVETMLEDFEDYDITFEVHESDPTLGMLHWAHIKNADLLVLGRKKTMEGSGLIPKRLARKAQCSLLFVPENEGFDIKNILVPIDFRSMTVLDMKHAQALAQLIPDSHLFVLYVFELPSGYYTTGKSEMEFRKILEENARVKFEKMRKELGIPEQELTLITKYNDRKKVAEVITEVAHQRQAKVIMLGAKGRNHLGYMLLGSVAEDVLQRDLDIPLLLVKEKNKTFNLLDLIKNI